MKPSTRSVNGFQPWLKDLTAPYRAHAAIALVLGVASFAFSALLMFCSGYLISKTAHLETTLFMVMVPVALVQVFGIARPIARYFERLVSHDWVFRATSSLRLKLFRGIAGLSSGIGKKQPTGAYLDALVEDIGHFQNLYLRVAFPAIIALLLFVCSLVFCGAFSVMLGVCMLACGVVSLLMLPMGVYLIVRPLQRRSSRMRSAVYADLTDDIMGAVDWALSGRNADALCKHEKATAALYASEATLRRTTRLWELGSHIALGAFACAVVVCAGAELGGVRVDYVSAFTLGFFPLLETFALLPGAAASYTVHSESAQSLSGLVSSNDAKQHDENNAGKTAESSALDDADFALELVHVSFRYAQGSAFSIKDVSIRMPKGQNIAIIGESGSGKTTLASLMRATLSPDEGTVRFGSRCDGSLHEDASVVSYIPQSPYVFDLTLRENLTIAKPNAEDDELVAVLEKVGLSGKLESLERGLDAPVGETGIGFSGGEAHRLAIARSLLSDAPIVLLDEPFAAIDPETERKLLDTLFEVFAEKTLIVITHHLAEIERFDRVVRLHEGRIVNDGPPRTLMQDDPWFNELVRFDRGLTSQPPLAP